MNEFSIRLFFKFMANIRSLKQDEIDEARKVFGNSIDYAVVYIQEHNGGAQTWSFQDRPDRAWYYIIYWSSDIYKNGAISSSNHNPKYARRTFIHEMTHVWQGQHGYYPREYWIKSGAAQSGGVWEDAKDKGITGVMKDVWNKGPLKTWHDYRNRAYAFNMNDIGGYNFNEFNVEQQASIIESWYAPDDKKNHLELLIPGGNMSTSDIRYPFITCNILTGKPNAQYIPLQAPAQNTVPQLGKGADAKIKAIQDILVQLGHLDSKYANGYKSREFRDAVIKYQQNNGLYPDGDIGGANSATRKKLRIR